MNQAKEKTSNPGTRLKTNNIDDAIKHLDQAANIARSEVVGVIRDGYSDLEERASDFVSEASEKLEQGVQSIKKAAVSVDKEAHRNPWAFIGGVAFGGLAIGFLLGRIGK